MSETLGPAKTAVVRREGEVLRNYQRAMSAEARRSGLEAFRAVLRRRHPGFDVDPRSRRGRSGWRLCVGGDRRGPGHARGCGFGCPIGSTLRPRPRERRTITVSMKPASTSRRSSEGRAR